MPYGEFFVDVGYKMYAKPEQNGHQEPYPVSFEMTLAQPQDSKFKSYKGRVGGHFILMFNGFLTTLINWVLLVVVMIEFTPAIFPSVNDQLA